MYKIKSKKFTILLTLIFVLSIMLPLAGPAGAATTYGKLTTPTVVPQTPAAQATLGTITISIDTLGAGTHQALVTLPVDFDLDLPATPPVFAYARSDGGAAGIYTTTVTTAGFAPNEFRLNLTTTAVDTGVLLTVTLPNITIPSDAEGDITATITGLAGQLSSGSVVVGKASTGAVTASVVSTVTITDAGNTVQFNFSENALRAIKRENATIKLTLPRGFTWDDTAATLTRVNDGTDALAAGWSLTGTGTRTLDINRPAGCLLAKGIFRLAVDVVPDDDAALGDVEVRVGGRSSISPSTLLVGTYKDYAVTVKAKSAPEVLAGRIAAEVGDIEIKEGITDSFLYNRTVIMELPAGAKWAMDTVTWAPTLTGGIAVGAVTPVGSDGRKLRFTVTDAAGGAGTILLEDLEVDLAVDFRGDLKVRLSGTAGLTDELVIAKVLPPVTVASTKKEVRIGIQAQAAGDITITESKAEALIGGKDLVVEAPAGANFAGLPKVEVVEGDVDIDSRGVAYNNNVLTIPINRVSAEASTIKISDIKYTIYRTLPEGDVNVNILGDAVDEVNDAVEVAAIAARPLFTAFNPGVTTAIFPQNDTAARVANATCVTPAPGEAKQSAAFVIGATTYTLGGVEYTMDVAPYVKDGRTYLPVRYAGYALGVAEENIFWDNSTGTATLIKGDRVVQFTVGSKAMVINGASIALDVAPEITNGRTMLPFRWIATAFGASVDWDGATQTVTMEL